MPTAPVPSITQITVPAAVTACGANFVLKVAYPVTSLNMAFVAVSAAAGASTTELITHQSPLPGTALDIGGTVTAILKGISV